MTQAGQYRRRVDIERPVRTRDSSGGNVTTWSPVWTRVPCKIGATVGKETTGAQQLLSDVTWRIAFRWRPGLDATMRCVEYLNAEHTQSTVYNVEAVLPDATNRREITLLCRTRDADGFRADG